MKRIILCCLFSLLVCGALSSACNDGIFIRGDFDGNGVVNFQDAMGIFNYASTGSPFPCDIEAADANDNGFIDGTDGVAVLNQVWNGLPLPPPMGIVGIDTTPDWLANQWSPRNDAFLLPICCTWSSDVYVQGTRWTHNWPTEIDTWPVSRHILDFRTNGISRRRTNHLPL